MGYCKECPDCGANLDPGEHCNCHEEQAEDVLHPEKITYQVRTERNAS